MNEMVVTDKLVIDSLMPINRDRVLKIEKGIHKDILRVKRSIFDIGRLLSAAKKWLPHRKFQAWIEESFGDALPYPTAAAFMSIYNHFQEHPKVIRYIPVSLLLLMKQKEFPEKILKKIEADPEGFTKLIDAAGVEKIKKACKAVQQGKISEDDFWAALKTPIKTDNGKFLFGFFFAASREEQLKDLENAKQILCRGFSQMKGGQVVIKAFVDDLVRDLGRDSWRREQWLPPFGEYLNREIDEGIKMLQEIKNSIGKISGNGKPIIIIGSNTPKDGPVPLSGDSKPQEMVRRRRVK
jgi:hypothetical protein